MKIKSILSVVRKLSLLRAETRRRSSVLTRLARPSMDDLVRKINSTDSDGFVNAVCHFPRYPPLQPKRIIIKTWNLAWTLMLGQIVGPSRRFLKSCPKVEIWGRAGVPLGGQKCQKNFFRFFSFFRLKYLLWCLLHQKKAFFWFLHRLNTKLCYINLDKWFF